MRKMFLICVVMMVMLFSVGCQYVEPGHVGIKVNMYGSEKGVADYPLLTGKVFYNPITEVVYKFPTYMLNYVWTSDTQESSPIDESVTFNSSEGAVINSDVAISFQFIAEKVPSLFMEFRQKPDVIINSYLRIQVRDVLNRQAQNYKATEIFGIKKQEILNGALEELNNRLEPRGFKIDILSFVGALRADKRVIDSINKVIEATQLAIEAQNKIKQTEAEANQRIAHARGLYESRIIEANGKAESQLIEAKAEAEANRLIAQSITPALTKWEGVRKWSGDMPKVVSGNAMPMVDLK